MSENIHIYRKRHPDPFLEVLIEITPLRN